MGWGYWGRNKLGTKPRKGGGGLERARVEVGQEPLGREEE